MALFKARDEKGAAALVEEGWHEALVLDTSLDPLRSGKGNDWGTTLRITKGPSKGANVYGHFYLDHDNQTARRIARSLMAELLEAGGLEEFDDEDPDVLKGLRVEMRVEIEHQEGFKPKAVPREFRKCGTGSADAPVFEGEPRPAKAAPQAGARARNGAGQHGPNHKAPWDKAKDKAAAGQSGFDDMQDDLPF